MQTTPENPIAAYLVDRPKRGTLRAARRAMAAGSASKRELSAMHTRSFPLAEAVSDAVWNQARDAALALRGFGQPSLFDVLMTAHAHGFRAFASGGERRAWGLLAQQQASGFDPAAAAAFPDCKSFTASALQGVLSVAPRKVGRETDVEVLAERLARSVGAPKVKSVQQVPEVLHAAATRIAEHYPTWAEMTADVAGAAGHFDAALKAAGHHLPALATALSGPEQVLPPGVGEVTLRWDPDAAWIADTDPGARLAGVIARYLPEVGGIDANGAAKALQSKITTANGNALSWLFGVGRRALPGESLDTACAALDASGERGRAATTALLDSLRRLPDLSAFGDRCYPDARATLQGSVDSLIANYVNRLQALRASVGSSDLAVPEALATAGDDAYTGLPFQAQEVLELYRAQPAEAAKAQVALDVLAGLIPPGDDGYAAAVAAVETYRAWVQRAAAVLNTLRDRLTAGSREDDDAAFELPAWTEGVDKIVYISTPEPEPESLYPELMAQMQALRKSRDEAFASLLQRYAITPAAVLQAAMQKVRDDEALAEARGRSVSSTTATYKQRGNRVLLDRLLRAVRKSNPGMWPLAVKLCEEHGLTGGAWTKRSVANYLQAGQSQIYLSPLSSRSHQVALEAAGLESFDVASLAKALIKAASRNGWLRDQVLLENAWWQIQAMGLPARVDASALPDIGEQVGIAWANLVPAEDGTVDRSEALKALNAAFSSKLSGLLYRLNRTAFVETRTVACFTGTTAVFVPKDTLWKAPAQYAHGKYAPFMAEAVLRDGAIDVVPTAKKWAKQASSLTGDNLRVLLGLICQLPHSWAVACDFAEAPTVEGLIVSGGTIQRAWVSRAAYHLQCPPHFERELAAAFVDRSLSPHSLTFERELTWDGEQVIEVGRKVVANIPISTPTTPVEPWQPTALMGIDLNEAGLGITLKSLSDGTERAGWIPIKRLRLLARSVEHYRNREQPRQSYRAKFSDSLAYAAEAAVGEICGVIDSLMVKCRAIPIFESGATRSKGTTPMVPKVFEAVIAHYAYLSSPVTAEATRTSHWYGAQKFEIPGWIELRPEARKMPPEQRDALSPEKRQRPLLVFPGTMISGYATSITCSCCGRNPIDLLKRAAEQGQLELRTDSEGIAELVVDGQTHRLAIEAPSTSPAVMRAARARNHRPPYVRLVDSVWSLRSATGISAATKAIKTSLRRPEMTLASRRGWGAILQCVFTDCAANMDADVNASTVLVRRYYDRLIGEQQAA